MHWNLRARYVNTAWICHGVDESKRIGHLASEDSNVLSQCWHGYYNNHISCKHYNVAYVILFRVVDFEIIKWTNKKQTKPSKTGLRWYFVSSRVFDASLAESGCELWLAQWLPLRSSSEMRFFLNSSPKTTNWENTYCKNFWILQDTIYIYTFEHIIKSLVDYRKNFKRYLNIDQGGK